MIYSVWDQSAGRYDYYRAGGEQKTANAPTPRHLRATKLGLTPAQAGWPLPAGAVKVGAGSHPRGRIASLRGGALAGIDLGSNGVKAVLLGVAGLLLWKYVR